MEFITIGKIINVRGLKGELKIFSNTDFSKQRYKKGNVVYFYNEETHARLEFHVAKHTSSGQMDYLFVSEIIDVDSATKYKNYVVQIDAAQQIKLVKGQFFFRDLTGCKVVNTEGDLFGTVLSVDDNGAHNNLRIQGDKKVILIPFVETFINKVDIENKTIVVNEIGGMRE